jgi:hypothetical protein
VEPLTAERDQMEKLYDQELMLGAGHIAGYKIKPESVERIACLLEKLACPQVFEKKYGVSPGTPPLLYAVGDGNHSLATAKQNWDDTKKRFTEGEREALLKSHPARFCLVEISNIFDEGIEFEPIHRILFDTKKCLVTAMQETYGADKVITKNFATLAELKNAVENPEPHHPKSACPTTSSSSASTPSGSCCSGGESEGCHCQWHSFGYVPTVSTFTLVSIPHGNQILPVGAVQTFIDESYKGQYSKIDYIHGDDVVMNLIKQGPGHNLGVFLPTMKKEELFPTVIKNARLPRKTFSMGEADEKRFYFECRKIVL